MERVALSVKGELTRLLFIEVAALLTRQFLAGSYCRANVAETRRIVAGEFICTEAGPF